MPWDDPENVSVFLLGSYAIKSLQNPSISAQFSPDGFRLIHYSANQWLIHRNSHIRLADITTGASSTMLLGDSAGQYVPAGYPYNWRDVALGLHRESPNCESPSFGCPARSSTMIAMADGTVRELNNRTDNTVLRHMAGPEELHPNPDCTSKPDSPYALKSARYWKFDWSSRGHKSHSTFRTSPDETTLLISLGDIEQSTPARDHWTSRFRDPQSVEKLEAIEIRGTLNSTELRSIWELPTLKRLDLSRAYVTGDVESILKEAPAGLSIEQ
ncbi:hypothetical protein [Schlesneria paludicola]|uniref:hypothetical protein n=1 Tax=Schlesneria paludicola TaxID=360056 RepID=UPI00138B1B5D|nr:hypothetical protein [Schlesneria paludicola]